MKNLISIRLLTILVLVVVAFLGLSFVKSILWPFVLAIVLAYILDPIVEYLERFGLGRSFSSIAVVMAFVSAVVGFLSVLLPLFSAQFKSTIVKLPLALDALYFKLEKWKVEIPNWAGIKESIVSAIKNIDTSSVEMISSNVQTVLTQISSFANDAFMFVLVLIMLYYLLKDWGELRHVFIRICPHRNRVDMVEWMNAVDQSVAGFLRGQLTVMIILGSWYAVALSILGLENAIAIGVLTGLIVFIPYVGAFIGVCIATLMGVMQYGDLWHLVLIWGIFAFGQSVESVILTPKIVGEKVGLHPVWIMFSLMAGATLFGFIGVLLAVPVTAAIGASIRFAFTQYLESDFYKAK